MPVDTKILRETAEDLNGKEWVKATFAARHQLFVAADEIDSLRAQFAEAKRQAIPWRDGPAKGGEMPADGDDAEIIAVMDLRSGMRVVKGTIDGVTLYHDGCWTSCEKVVRWSYASDLIPASKGEMNP